MNNKLIDRFQEMVRIDAQPRDERAMADYLMNQLTQLGFSVREDDAAAAVGGNTGNLIARLPGTLPGTVLFAAHMDRVEQGLGIQPIVDGNVIRTDGSTILAADDVTGLVTILEAVRSVRASGKSHCTVEVLFTVCEERGCLGSALVNPAELQANVGYVLDDGAHFGTITNEAPFKAVVTIEVFGTAAHAAESPETGVNAVLAACTLLTGIPDGRIDFETTSNIGTVCGGGDNIGTVCDYVKLQGEVRSHNEQKLWEQINRIRRQCEERAPNCGVRCQVSAEIAYTGYSVPETAPVFRRARTVVESMGGTVQVRRAMGGTDGNHLNRLGIPCVGISCGFFDIHTTSEYQCIDDLENLCEFIARVITTEDTEVHHG